MTSLLADNGLSLILLKLKKQRSSDEEWMLYINELDILIKNNASVLLPNSMKMLADGKMHLSS